MSRYSYVPLHQRPHIVVHDHDVLAGRGVNIALHPGNQRLRTLVTTRADESFCTSYSATEKRAVAEEIVRHIKQLDPPGRFLKRDGRGQVSRGLSGPWEELTERDAVKKVCQALRDCNRLDRQGYAVGVAMPSDVVQAARHLQDTGLTGKQHAARAAAQVAAAQAAATIPSCKRDWGRVSPSVENAAEWLKKQRTDENTTVTPSTTDSDAGGLVTYDPASLGGPSPYEAFPAPAKYATAPSPMYASAPLESYAQPTVTIFHSDQGNEAYSQPPPLPHFPTGPSVEPFRPAPMYHMAPSSGTYQQDPAQAPYEQNGGQTPAPAAVDQTNSVSPDQANHPYTCAPTQDYPGAPEHTHQTQSMFAPDPPQGQSLVMALPSYSPYPGEAAPPPPPAQSYVPASQLAPSPYAHASAPADGGVAYHPQTYQQTVPTAYQQAHSSNGAYAVSPSQLYHGGHTHPYHVTHGGTAYDSTPTEGYHSTPAPGYEPILAAQYQRDTTQDHEGVALQGYNPAPDSSDHKAESRRDTATVYAAPSEHIAYRSSTESPPTYQQTGERDLQCGPPSSPHGTEPVYPSASTCYHTFDDASASTQHPSSHTFAAAQSTQSVTGYDHGHVVAASAGADLLISVAYQTTAPAARDAEDRANSSIVAADKWEGERMGL